MVEKITIRLVALFTFRTTDPRQSIHIFLTLQVESIFRAPVEGVVLETFGAGNCPNHRTRFVEILKEAIDRGVIIINCTQCLKGAVIKAYETGKVKYCFLLFVSICELIILFPFPVYLLSY